MSIRHFLCVKKNALAYRKTKQKSTSTILLNVQLFGDVQPDLLIHLYIFFVSYNIFFLFLFYKPLSLTSHSLSLSSPLKKKKDSLSISTYRYISHTSYAFLSTIYLQIFSIHKSTTTTKCTYVYIYYIYM